MGDGAVRQGAFHETMNLAMLWNVPCVFIIENNGYAMGTSVSRTATHEDIYKLGLGYEMPCSWVDGMHPEDVYPAIQEAVDRARSGGGPTLLEVRTYRYKGHSMSDAQKYRTKEEVARYQEIDPIKQILGVILDKKYASQEQIDEIDLRVKKKVKECVDFAENSPFPDKEELWKHIYIQEDYPFIKE